MQKVNCRITPLKKSKQKSIANKLIMEKNNAKKLLNQQEEIRQEIAR